MGGPYVDQNDGNAINDMALFKTIKLLGEAQTKDYFICSQV